MIKSIIWAYKTQFRYNKNLPLKFRLWHAYKMFHSMYTMRPKDFRNERIKVGLKQAKKVKSNTNQGGE